MYYNHSVSKMSQISRLIESKILHTIHDIRTTDNNLSPRVSIPDLSSNIHILAQSEETPEAEILNL